MRAALLLAAALLARAGGAAGAAATRSVPLLGDVLTDGAVALEGHPLYRLDRAFERTCVTVTCHGANRYETLTAHSEEAALARRGEALSGHRELFCISPLGSTWLALRRVEGGLWRLPSRSASAAGSGSAEYCTAQVSAAFSRRHALLALAGAALFAAAPLLANSAAFRVSSGGVLTALFALLILVYYFTRPLRQRHGAVLAALSVGAGSFLYGWVLDSFSLSSWQSILASPYLLAYLGVTFTAGAAVTHVLDRPSGEQRSRITAAFEAVLRAGGGVALCVGVLDLRLGGAAVLLLCLAEALRRGLDAAAARRAHRAAPGSPAAAPAAATPTPISPDDVAMALLAAWERRQAMASPQTQIVPERSPAAAAPERTPSAPDSELVRSGMAINPTTGRSIKIGGPLYNKLVSSEGYQLNRSTGIMEKAAVTAPLNVGGCGGGFRGFFSSGGASPAAAVTPRRLADAMGEAGGAAAARRGGGVRSASPRGRARKRG